MKNEVYTREEVEYMLKKMSEQVYDVVFRVGYISREETRIMIQHLLDARR